MARPVHVLLRVDTVGRRIRADFVLDIVESLVLLADGDAIDHVFRAGAAEFTVILTAVRHCLCLRPPLTAWLMIGANCCSTLGTIGAVRCCSLGAASVCTLVTCCASWDTDLVCQRVPTPLISCSLGAIVVGLVAMDGLFFIADSVS